MADNRDKNQNQDKPQPVKKPADKDVAKENREIQKDLDTDETDEDEQGEITQRNPRIDEDEERR